MRLLIDLTNSPHVPFFAPLIDHFESEGHEVVVTARRFAQTIELAKLFDLPVTVIGEHGGTTRFGKAKAALHRIRALDKYVRKDEAKNGAFAAALSHGSTDLPLVARRRGIPHVTIFDYEWAKTMHRLNCRASWRVVVPDAIPLERLDQYGAAGKIRSYPGIKEEYYLNPERINADELRSELKIPADHVLVTMRPPADMALYHRGFENTLFNEVITRVERTKNCSLVIVPRTDEQRHKLQNAQASEGAKKQTIILDRAVDGASLVAASDLVISAGGTMNREAVALGVPVYTIFAGRMGGVDEHLIRAGKLVMLESASQVRLEKRPQTAVPFSSLRPPRELAQLLLEGLPTL